MEEHKDSQDEEQGGKKRVRLRKIAGVVLVVAGIAIILSVIIVPLINKSRNEKDIADIRAGKYADQTESSGEAVTPEAVVSDAGVSEQAAEPSERDQKMAGILADNSRIGIVEIEKIDVLYAIIEGTEDEQINRAIGHLTGSAGIGQEGNCVIAGHRGGYYGTFFERLPELENGDEVVLTDVNGVEYHYVVYDKKMVDPPDWSVTADLISTQGEKMHTLTMITCEDDTRKRIVVFATMF